jgi:hypothetical protein
MVGQLHHSHMGYKPKNLGVSRQDWKYVNADPDPDFNADHNNKVIEETIQDNELRRKRAKKRFDDGIRDRSEAISVYLKSLQRGGKTSDFNKYFGRREIARLRGEEIMGALKAHYAPQKQKS